MLTLLSFCGWITGRDLQPRQIEFVYPEPADLRVHAQAFACPLRFGQQANRALLDAEELAWPLAAHFFRACKRWFGESPGRYRARFLTPLEKANPTR